MSDKSTRPSLTQSTLNKLKLPLPPLSLQNKIVKVLDKFQVLLSDTKGLIPEEIEKRQKQYEYYRDMLLSEEYLNAKVERLNNITQKEYRIKSTNLEEIIKIKNGKDWKKLGQGNIPVYGSGGKMNVSVDKYSYNKPTVLIPRKGSIENVFYVEDPIWNVDTIFYTEIDEKKILPKYFYYFIENYDIAKLSTDSTRPSLTQSVLNKVRMNLPPTEIQNEVVQILDNFDNLINEISQGLPKEIELRQKQYEYYREKLLDFKKN